jgi:serine protease Do
MGTGAAGAALALFFAAAPTAAAGAPAAAPWPPAQVAARVGPCVVGILTLRRGYDGRLEPAGAGSGLVIRPDGAIVTNFHVVEGADALRVTLSDGRTLPGRVVGVDPPTDIAVLRVAASGLPTPTWADSRRLRVGEMAIAIGNPMGSGFARTVTVGVVSGLGRSLGLGYALRAFELIQTDAAINPGNSGGPLVDAQGRVIGLNSVKIAAPAVESMGFALPSNTVREVAEEILRHGRVERPWLGLVLMPRELAMRLGLPAPERGLRVERVYADGPSDRAGVAADDALVAVDGREVSSLGDLFRALAGRRAGDRVHLTLERRGRRRTVAVVLAPLPAQVSGRAGTVPGA